MIDQYPSANGVLTSLIWRKTMSGGETSLSGYDNASQALSYTPGQEQVYLNGILLVRGDDYTATNGTSITGLSALAASDFVQVNCYNNFSVASLPTSGLVGEISNSQITSLATSKLTGTVTNAQLAGSISNDKLSNSSITINGSAVSLGGSATIAGGSAQDSEPTSPTEGQLWLDTNGTLATTAFTEKSTLTTTGDIYYASAADTPARLGIGSTGNILTVSGGVPAWSAPAAGGSMTLLTTTNLSGTTTSITSINQTYKNLMLRIRGLTVTTATFSLYVKVNGSTTNCDGIDFNGVSQAALGGAALSPGNAGHSASSAINDLDFIFSAYAGTTYKKPYQYFGICKMASQVQPLGIGGLGAVNSNTAISSFDISNDSGGSFTAGIAEIWGIN